MSSSSPRRFASSSNIASSRPGASGDMLMLAIQRVQDAIDTENAKIASARVIDLQEFNLRKSQGLLELSRLMPLFAGVQIDAALREALTLLRAKLEENRRILRVQLKAVQQVSEIISRTIQAGQSDGTYSAFSWRE
jgi:hypothetical protein